ncbi:MAG: carbon-nitrogen hydrolase family protein [Gemmataceae bacterium]|nr:carbon-nitrogen hydrolase family protein [Gemmataceae bacterium]
MDCRLADPAANRRAVCDRLAVAADRGARLAVFPECVVTGYGFRSRDQVRAVAEPLPGPSTDAVARECARLGVWAVFGLIEHDPAADKLYNSCALVGPTGYFASYRKAHLPCLGADRFTDPGDRPFAVHDLGGLKLGMNICFDGSFPETSRVLTLLGADLIVLPTNWATNARTMAELVSAARAWENHVYYLAVNRVGEESGFRYIGLSSAADCLGKVVHRAPEGEEHVFTMAVDPAAARAKRVVNCPGEYEIDRVNWRRPDLYGPLVTGDIFAGHQNRPPGSD